MVKIGHVAKITQHLGDKNSGNRRSNPLGVFVGQWREIEYDIAFISRIGVDDGLDLAHRNTPWLCDCSVA